MSVDHAHGYTEGGIVSPGTAGFTDLTGELAWKVILIRSW